MPPHMYGKRTIDNRTLLKVEPGTTASCASPPLHYKKVKARSSYFNHTIIALTQEIYNNALPNKI